MSNHGPESNRLLSILFSILAVVAVGSYLINEMFEPDIWWHLAIGNDIIRTHAVPTVDRYTVAALGRAYHDSHWLFQVILALANKAAGMAGVEGVMVGAWALTLLAMLKATRKWVSTPVVACLVFVAALACSERFLPRPEIVTYLMLVLFYLRLQEGKYRSWNDLAILAALQVVWTNCHGLFVLGPCLIGAYWVVAAVKGPRETGSDFMSLGKALAAVAIASLVSPFGIRGWQYALLLMTEVNPEASVALKTVGELSPTFGAAARKGPAFWFFLALLILTVAAVMVSAIRGKVAPGRIIIVIAMAGLAMTGRRNMALFALVAAPIIAEHAWWVREALGRRVRVGLLAFPALLMMASAAYALSGRYYLAMEIPGRFGWGVTPSYYPYGLPEFLRRTGFKGNVFNSNILGGFYMYNAFPAGAPLTDGRWEIYDRNILNLINRGSAEPALLERIVSEYGIKAFLVQHPSPEATRLLPLLSHDPRWRLVYYDQAASFWERSDLPNLPPAVDLSGAQTAAPLPARIDDSIILDRFYHGVGASELRLRNLTIIAKGPGGEATLEHLGEEALKEGQMGQAEKIYQVLYKVAPKNMAALNELAFLAYQRGDRPSAIAYLRSALEIHPGDPEITANYNRLTGGR